MKRLAIALVALFAAVSAHAQLGVVAGVTSTSTKLEEAYKDIAKTQSVTQYHAGIVYNLNLPLGFSIQPGVIYNMKGASLNTNLNGVVGMESLKDLDVQVDTKTGYLEVPVRVAWGINVANVIKPFIFAEPFVGYAINTETKTKFKDDLSQQVAQGAASALGVKLETTNSDADKWVDRNRINYGLGLGAGITALKRLSLSVKYYWDFGAAFTTSEDGKTSSSISAAAVGKALKDQKCNGIVASLTLYF